MSNHTVDVYIEIEDEDHDLCVNFDYTPAERGHKDKYGCQMEPDFDEEIELCHVWNVYEDDILGGLSKEVKERIIEKLFEYKENQNNHY